MIITANELKTKGISLLKKALEKDIEIGISERGKTKYIAMSLERYNELREAELSDAINQAKEDYKNGNVVRMTVEEHIAELEKCLK